MQILYALTLLQFNNIDTGKSSINQKLRFFTRQCPRKHTRYSDMIKEHGIQVKITQMTYIIPNDEVNISGSF